MLDGLRGRSGFYTKCKSLIKLTRTRIDVVRRKRNATQKFLRKDIADLLANGLDANAYGRVEGLIAELILSSCYDFIEHVCEIILKHLPVLQKLRECPEDCREAVASLMFAAARLSDLPELRELRDLFQERYGSSLGFYVNQKLVENLTPKPPSMEKKVHLMQEIASEFSIRWDSKGFEERMSNPSTGQNQQKSPGNVPTAENKVLTPVAEKNMHKTVKDEDLVKKRSEATYQNKEREVDDKHHKETGKEGIPRRGDYLKNNISEERELATETNKPPSYREEIIQKREHHHVSYQRREKKTEVHDSHETSGLEAAQFGNSSRGKTSVPERESPNTLSQQKPASLLRNNGTHFPYSVNNEVVEDVQIRSMRKRQEVKDGSKYNSRSAIPPPYVKPRKSKHKADLGLEHANIKSENVHTNPDGQDHLNGATVPEISDGPGCFTEIYYKDASRGDFTPRRRSYRRKNSRSMSTKDDGANDEVGQEERVVRRVSSNRRNHESRKGLQIVVDDDNYARDKEEKMIDKLLLHYSKKPSAGDPGKKSRNTGSEMNNARKSPDQHKAVDGTHAGANSVTTSRSMSLPTQQATQPEAQKVFNRTSSFQQDTPAKHVHPKLPDYDDLAARFAALRAAKG